MSIKGWESLLVLYLVLDLLATYLASPVSCNIVCYLHYERSIAWIGLA